MRMLCLRGTNLFISKHEVVIIFDGMLVYLIGKADAGGRKFLCVHHITAQ